VDLKKLELEEQELQLEAEKAGVKLSLDTELAKSKLATDTMKLLQENAKE